MCVCVQGQAVRLAEMLHAIYTFFALVSHIFYLFGGGDDLGDSGRRAGGGTGARLSPCNAVHCETAEKITGEARVSKNAAS